MIVIIINILHILINLPLCLSICLSVCLCVCLSLSVYLSVCPSASSGSLEGLDQYSPVLTPRGNSAISSSSSADLDPQIMMVLGSGSKLSALGEGEIIPAVMVNAGERIDRE